jgi:undecaprenyl-diphosphatase
MLKKIIEIDQYLFLKINRDSRNAAFDWAMPFIRESKFWLPLYLFLLVFVVVNFGKKAYWWIFFAASTAITTDLISSRIFKPLFGRPRPCMDPDFAVNVRLLANYCGSNGSFTSSHASNHFGMAMFCFMTFRHFAPKAVYLFFIWAAIICLAQVYVGVHYPTDILGGALIGLLAGWFSGNYHNKKIGLLH